jgi:parvulin-like peptidyl-prolyl isomerase
MRQFVSCIILLNLGLFAACRKVGDDPYQPPIVAVVDGQNIDLPTLEREWEKHKRFFEGRPQDRELSALRKAVLDEVIDRTLLLRAATAADLTVSDAEVAHKVAGFAGDYKDEARYAEVLLKSHISPDELNQSIHDRLLVEKLFIKQVHARIAVTDGEIEEYYNARKADFMLPERVEAAMIVVKTEAEAKDLRNRLWRGEKFEDLAKQHSLSPEGAKGGNLGVFARGAMPPLFEICFTLREGSLSQEIPSSFGFHIFKTLKRYAARERPLAEVGAEIETILLEQRRRKAEKEFMETLRSKATITVNRDALAILQ